MSEGKEIPTNFIAWLTKCYGAHPLLAPTLWATGKLPKPKWLIERENEEKQKQGSKPEVLK